MKKNIVKTMLKAAATTAMVAAMFVGGNKMEAKAAPYWEYIDSYNKLHGTNYTDDDFVFNKELGDDIDRYRLSIERPGVTLEQARYEAATEAMSVMSGANVEQVVDPTISHQNMLALVNADRTATGVGTLTWNVALEEAAKARATEIMGNAFTEDFKTAVESGDPAAYSEVVHRGHREGLGENAIVSFYSGVTEETANANWIASAGHHEARTRAGYTMYACASYTEPVSGMEVWVEIFQ